LRSGELLCLISDGVTEAQNLKGDLYGNPRVRHVLLKFVRSVATADAIVKALRMDVETFAAGAEPADDVTILALRWNGTQVTG